MCVSGFPTLPRMDGWVRVLRPFNSISVISRRWKGEYERLYAMKRRLGTGRISPAAGFEPATPWSEVGSANRSATRTLQPYLGFCSDPKYFIVNCKQNVVKSAGKWGKKYWKMQFLYKIFWQNKILCRPTIPSFFRAETWNTHISFGGLIWIH